MIPPTDDVTISVATGVTPPVGVPALFTVVNAASGHRWFPNITAENTAAEMFDHLDVAHQVTASSTHLVGYAALVHAEVSPRATWQPPPGWLELTKVMVAPRHRGRGYAAMMVELLLAQHNAPGVYLSALREVAAMYHRYGFDVVGADTGVTTGRHLELLARHSH